MYVIYDSQTIKRALYRCGCQIVETDASNILFCLQSNGESNETGAEDTFIVSVVYMMQAMVHDCMKMKVGKNKI